MNKKFFGILTAVIFVFCALGIGALVIFPAPWAAKKNKVEHQARIILPQDQNTRADDTESEAELLAREDSLSTKVPLEDGEVVVTILNDSTDGSSAEKQYVAYRNLLEADSPIYLTYIDYDEASKSYKRFWTARTAATQPGTVTLSTQDILGDRSVCILLSGLNGLGEHTLTIFHRTDVPENAVQKNASQGRGSGAAENELFSKIADISIDGTISINETDRPQAYQMGLSKGQSFTIAAYGRDFESNNIMDQVEIIYEYNTVNGLFEQKTVTRIPGTQIEQRRVRELLGNTKSFEDFVTGLWYFVTPEGTIDKGQYIYFDPDNQEIIFYGDETQQVFTWQNSTATRYGIYVASQNISITTLRRSIDIELESLDSIKVKVFEDVRLNIKGVNAPWDGSYRKAGPLENRVQNTSQPGNTFINAYYDSTLGKIHFLSDGTYELNAGGTTRQGKYSFFSIDDENFLELRSAEQRTPDINQDTQEMLRETFMIEDDSQTPKNNSDSDPIAAKNPAQGTATATSTVTAPSTKTATPTVQGTTAGETAAPETPANPGQADTSPRKTLTLQKIRIGAKGIEIINEGKITLTLVSE